MAVTLQRVKSLAWFGLLVVLAEVVGGSLTTHVDRRLHVMPLTSSSASYYPFLLVAVKVAAAIGLPRSSRESRASRNPRGGRTLLMPPATTARAGLPRFRTTSVPACLVGVVRLQLGRLSRADEHGTDDGQASPRFCALAPHVCAADVRRARGCGRVRSGVSFLAARRRGIRLRHSRSRPPDPLLGPSRAEPFTAGRRAPAAPPLRALTRFEASSADGLKPGRFYG